MIKIDELSKFYNKKQRRALFNVDLELPDSGLIFIVGKTGSGKSSLLNIIGCIDQDYQGTVLFNNTNIRKMENKEKYYYRSNDVSFIFQDYNLIEEYTVMENIRIAVNIQGKSISDNEILEILKKLNIEEYAHRLPYMMSGGERQRIAIARAICKKTPVILADEPTGALDMDTSINIIEILKEMSKTSLVIIVTHNETLALNYGDQIIRLKKGQIIEHLVKEKNINSHIDDCNDFFHNRKKNLISIPFKDKTKISFLNLKFKIPRIILIILLNLFTLTVIGLLTELVCFNFKDLNFREISSYNRNYIYAGSKNGYFDNEEIDQLNTDFVNTVPVYDFFNNQKVSLNLSDFVDSNFGHSSGGIEGTQENFDFFNIKLIVGRLPTKDNEVVITKSLFECYKEYGLIEHGYVKHIKNYESVLDRNITVINKNFKICGIVDTGLEFNSYNLLSKNINIKKEFDLLTYSSIHSALFFNQGLQNKQEENITDDILYLAVPFKNSKNDIEALVNYFDKSETYISDLSFEIEINNGKQILFLKNLLVYVAIFLIFFNFLLFYSYFVVSLINQKNKIGVLISLGSRFRDVFVIYFIESLFISFISCFLSYISISIIIETINQYILSNYLLNFKALNFSFISIIVLFIISLINAFIVAFISIRQFYKKQLHRLLKRF